MTGITLKRQSPIDIRTSEAHEDVVEGGQETISINYVKGDCSEVGITDHGWKVEVSPDCTSTVTAFHLPSECKYELAQFHAHWANDGSCGSEHLLDGKALSGEVHFVFWNTKYNDFEHAADEGDGLAVIGVFIKEGKENPAYSTLVHAIEDARLTGKRQPLPHDFDLEALLPPREERDFVHYQGSLTTPPYSESVIWTVMVNPVELSHDQLNCFRKICKENYRPCQELCERKVTKVKRAARV